MIELTKVKTDVINYGAMKVYNTFLLISQDEVDPELFTQKQLNDIFAKKYDIIKVNIDFVVDEENEVVEHECLVFKLGKASDSTVTYMSNVSNEGSLSSLVLTKENDEVSLEVVEYSLAGDGGTKLYKHQLDFDPEYNRKKIHIYSNSPTELTVDDLLINELASYISMFYNYCLVVLKYAGIGKIYYFDDKSSTITSVSINDFGTYQGDTVTEL